LSTTTSHSTELDYFAASAATSVWHRRTFTRGQPRAFKSRGDRSFRRSSAQPRPILNSFCRDCYLQSNNNPPTLDPRSDLHNPPNVLNTPSLIDVSKCSSPDHPVANTWGEAAVVHHDNSPDLVRDCTRSVSDASQNDTDESAVCRNSFVPDPPSGSASSSSLDDESGNHTTTSPQSQSTTPFETMNELASLTPSPRSKAGLVTQYVVVLPLPNGRFKCPKCPRIFPGLGGARSVS
jgi:hypothetical protein